MNNILRNILIGLCVVLVIAGITIGIIYGVKEAYTPNINEYLNADLGKDQYLAYIESSRNVMAASVKKDGSRFNFGCNTAILGAKLDPENFIFPVKTQNTPWSIIKANDNQEDTFKIKHTTLGYLNAATSWGNHIYFREDDKDNVWRFVKVENPRGNIVSYQLYSNVEGYKELSVQYKTHESRCSQWMMYHDNQKNWAPMQFWLLAENTEDMNECPMSEEWTGNSSKSR